MLPPSLTPRHLGAGCWRSPCSARGSPRWTPPWSIDIVSVWQWLISAEDIRAYVEVRNKFITHKPAAFLGVIPGLVRPDFLIEIEVVAAVPAGKVKGDQ